MKLRSGRSIPTFRASIPASILDLRPSGRLDLMSSPVSAIGLQRRSHSQIVMVARACVRACARAHVCGLAHALGVG
eukprot:11830560-Alexandrium_andersonii.AAC.1